MQQHRTRRRRILRLAGLVATATLAGCGSSGSDGSDGGDSDDDGGGGYGGGESEDGDGDGGGTGGTNTDSDGEDADGDQGADDSETATATATPTETPGTDELDLREANVVGVAFAGGDGSYDFDVTLHHDDDGEEGYANWWQVERLDGTQLGRRDLTHPHSQQPFTRSTTLDIPAEVTCVVVRGHDQTHGYGGRAVLVNLDSGATRGVMQGPDPQSFEASDCP